MTETSDKAWVSSTHHPMSFRGFVATVAAIMALNPLALDLMLPGLPDLASAFRLADVNHAQAVLSVFLVGFGGGQFIMGPLSDRFGRRPILIGGLIVYVVASLLAIAAPTFETLLLARFLQGLGTSASRVIATSIVRDCYSGRRMASVMSLAMMIFISVPLIAPSLGQIVMLAGEWRGMFIVLMLYGVLTLVWTGLRLPETLPLSERKSLAAREVAGNVMQTLTNRQTFGYALAAGCVQGVLFGYVLSSQQIFTVIYDLGPYFPIAFGAVALGVAVAGFVNSQIVGRFGMRVISHSALAAQIAIALTMLAAAILHWLPLWLFMLLSTANMFAFGLIFSNFSALAMEPQGHIAGTASSLFGSITTLVGIGVGALIGQHFNGTLMPLAGGAFAAALVTLAIVLVVEKGRLFVPHNKPV
ncbi:MAG: multidrug effflux MFS transporter [Afipia sp.]|nr:multidrug effflux MFS transporter [Afipia sp.]